MLDVPLTLNGIAQANLLYGKLGRLDAIYHDSLSRCWDTADLLHPHVTFKDLDTGPWKMGYLFEGREITEDSLELARYYIDNPYSCPPGGEKFFSWTERWMGWLERLDIGHSATGIVTHNRNIQYLYACQHGRFSYKMYDCDGPDFCSVHVYRDGYIAPWGGKNVPKGLYIIRHGETEFGT